VNAVKNSRIPYETGNIFYHDSAQKNQLLILKIRIISAVHNTVMMRLLYETKYVKTLLILG
jgi:hypothetical protein